MKFGASMFFTDYSIPAAQLAKEMEARGFDTLAVAMQYDPPAHVANYAETRRLPFGVVIVSQVPLATYFQALPS